MWIQQVTLSISYYFTASSGWGILLTFRTVSEVGGGLALAVGTLLCGAVLSFSIGRFFSPVESGIISHPGYPVTLEMMNLYGRPSVGAPRSRPYPLELEGRPLRDARTGVLQNHRD